ncbi:hypothetical protein KFL_000220300 [Klebsormidium nitens]|uniref:Ubiquitin-like domain-containing protein n=1 Tax=Klebsormidium nitens TaxID=105231 RepID=A0A1Y1HP69_KLENI|nr:hypothetical protein KFL_000220300 [Klebsormidium nitens]|eukprot:GAQ78999.1 hypothetical protein KFL_000220300 [Klebsormidium nitens]
MIASDEPGLEVLSHNQWKLVPAKLADNEVILLSGQALFEATGGHLQAARHRVAQDEGRARFSLAFKCRPQLQAVFDRGPIADANPTVARKYRSTERLLPVAKYMADFDICHASVNKAGIQRDISGAVHEPGDPRENAPSSQERKDEGRITVTLQDQSGCKTVFTCRPSLRVRKLRDAWLSLPKNSGLAPDSFSLYFGGRLHPWETLLECSVEDGDVIDVMMHQCGD